MEKIFKPKCDCCGKFIPLISGFKVNFVPDSALSIENTTHICEKCINKR